MTDRMLLYHTGFHVRKDPDVHVGRKNADFGQGFYMSGDEEFAHRWAREQKGASTIVNTYELDLTGLKIHRFEKDLSWAEYIINNRAGKPDSLPEMDVIIGAIANDIIFETFGIITSGFLSREEALQLLLIGPTYEQIVLKTDRAAAHLKWLSSQELTGEELAQYRAMISGEEAAYQRLFAEAMEKLA